MTATVIPYVDAAEALERDRKAFRLRLAGLSERRIAEELGVSIADVDSAVARMSGGVTPSLRQKTLQIELERLDDFQRAHFAKASAGDVQATLVSLKIMERRSRMLGLETPLRETPFSDEGNGPGGYDRILNLINEIAAEPTIIEGEVVAEGVADGAADRSR